MTDPTSSAPKAPKGKKADNPNEYEVQVGENLLDIANKFSVSVDSLARVNSLATGYRNPAPGTIIKLYED